MKKQNRLIHFAVLSAAFLIFAGLCGCSRNPFKTSNENAPKNRSIVNEVEIIREEPAKEPAEYGFEAVYYWVNGWQNQEYPQAKLFKGRDELAAFFENHRNDTVLSVEDIDCDHEYVSIEEKLEKYNENWFVSNNLLMLLLEEPSGSLRHRVMKLTEKDVVIDRLIPYVCTDDMAEWYILIETEKGFAIKDEQDFHIEFIPCADGDSPVYVYPSPAVKLDGEVYYSTGIETEPICCDVFVGVLVDSCDEKEKPKRNGQANFAPGCRYQFKDKDGGRLKVEMPDGKCFIFATEEAKQRMTEESYGINEG